MLRNASDATIARDENTILAWLARIAVQVFAVMCSIARFQARKNTVTAARNEQRVRDNFVTGSRAGEIFSRPHREHAPLSTCSPHFLTFNSRWIFRPSMKHCASQKSACAPEWIFSKQADRKSTRLNS